MSAADEAIEIYRDAAPGARRVIWVEGTDGGGVQLIAQDLGERVKEAWGDSDYEFWFAVAPDAVRPLLFALLADRFGGRADAVDAFRAWCVERGIDGEGGSYA